MTFFAGCSQQKGASDREKAAEPTPADQEQQAQQTQSEQLSGDTKFIAEAAQDGRAEIELAQTATTKASNPAVKRLAQKLVTDHTKLNHQLESLPQASQAMQSAGVPAEKQAAVDRLSQLSGKEFDRAFVEQLVQDHESAVSLFKEAASSAQSPEVKQFASRALPVLQQHLEAAKSLENRLSASTGGEQSQR